MGKECSNESCSKESCEGCPSREKPDFHVDLNRFSHVAHVIGVVSGKGGVGKSFVTASMANAMAAMGYRTGILDADITGPSIPRMYGLHGPTGMDEQGIRPLESANGISVMSVNLLLPGEDEPVIWRGPVIANMVKQFWTDVVWGELDYLFVDMPPGTGDVPLTVFQSLPVDGILIVTSPQELVEMIVTKAYKMAVMMKIPVLGLIENYSYILCPDCGKKISVFGESHVEEVAGQMGLPVLGRLPIESRLAGLADEGRFAEVLNEYLDDAAAELRKFSVKE